MTDDLPGDDHPSPPLHEAAHALSRRNLLIGSLGLVALGAATAGGVAAGVIELPGTIRRRFADTGVDGVIPAVPAGTVTLTSRASQARGQQVGFFTAVPDGYGDGAGLPVCLILHGATATTADYEAFGFGQFITAAVRDEVPPFVLVGADGGRTFWAGDGATDDPQQMLRVEIPAWCDELGFDTSRMAGYGWSMGGHGVLLAAARNPGWLTSIAALSPAVSPGDDVFASAGKLAGDRTGIWCGTADALYENVQALAAEVPGGPAIAAYAPGAHTRGYWNRITPDAFAFVGASLV